MVESEARTPRRSTSNRNEAASSKKNAVLSRRHHQRQLPHRFKLQELILPGSGVFGIPPWRRTPGILPSCLPPSRPRCGVCWIHRPRGSPRSSAEALLAAEGRWASKLLQGRSVVDITPGISSATSELALGAESLVVVSPRGAITEVLRERSEPESGFDVRLAEPSDMPFDEGSFGAAVFFEAGRSTAGEIEGVLREVARILDKENGLLITSLGVPSVRTAQWQGVLQTLTTTLEELFSNVSVVELTISLTATFSSAPTAAALETGRGSDAAARPVLDRIVIASNGPLPDFRTSSALSFQVDLELWERSREALLETARISQARAAEPRGWRTNATI